MKTTETSAITVTGATWAFVQTALGGWGSGEWHREAPGFANTPGKLNWVKAAERALQAAGLDPDLAQDVVFSSTRPMSGTWRDVTFAEGAAVASIDDDMGGEWRLLLPDNFTWAQWGSGTSGSTITVELEEGGTWEVTGEFPVTDEGRYEGTYFGCLEQAIQQDAANTEVAAKAASILAARRAAFNALVAPLHSALRDGLEAFQEWALQEDDGRYVTATPEDVRAAGQLAVAAGWTGTSTLRRDVAKWGGRDGRVLVLEVVPPAGWDQEFLAQLSELESQWQGAGRNPAAPPAPIHLPVLPLA